MQKIKDITYRPDIDGLRAVAVLLVVFYHFGLFNFTGGYIGVDVFFVISGYLITGLIVRELQQNNFSLITFYERRIRRIFPAFFTVSIVLGIVGYFYYSEKAYSDLWNSIGAATTSTANFLFYSQIGYFNAPALQKPMLHTWSLSVEEQFYIFLPLILFITIKFAQRWLKHVLIFILILSFVGNVYFLQKDPPLAFYMSYLRAWELLVGSLLAIQPIALPRWAHEALSLSGLIAIISVAFIYNTETLFPGVNALVPVMGTMFIINSGHDYKSLVGKILSTAPMIFIGKISYSLYLWHWPILVFGSYYLVTKPSIKYLALFGLLSVILSFLTWKFIEIPFRNKNFLQRPRIFDISISMAVILLIAAFLITKAEGLPSRINRNKILPPSVWDSQNNLWGEICWDSTRVNWEECSLGNKHIPATFLVWGNSHAGAFAPGFNKAANESNQHGIIYWKSACSPLLNNRPNCQPFSDGVINFIRTHTEIKTIIIANRWLPGDISEDTLDATIQELTNLGREIYLVLPVPESKFHVPNAYFITRLTNRSLNEYFAPRKADYLKYNKPIFKIFEKMAQKYNNVHLVDISDVFCVDDHCILVKNNMPLYRDDDHLSTAGALLISDKFNEIFSH